MGGPIDYMYIGPMNVQSKFDNGVLTVNGKLTSAEKYAESHELYFRLRARREDQTFDPTSKYTNGAPKIYSRSPSKKEGGSKLVVIDKPASNRDLITF